MASFIYFYAKFTEELLLLSAAGVFTLLAIYCYTWVVKKRRLGAARDQIPAGMVKVYLNQLINEAQFVRTQLFGLVGGAPAAGESFAAHFQATPGASHSPAAAGTHAPGGEIPSDLLERLKALEHQLADKESMVVNINVEKTKLLEEVENLKQNEKAMGAAPTGNNEDLIQKIKALEERLEEYALFEDDLANLKRLQQENASLKKQIDSAVPAVAASAPQPAAARNDAFEPKVEPTKEPTTQGSMLDQSAIDALLNGSSAVPPTPVEAAAPAETEPSIEAFAEPIDIAPKPAAQVAAPQAAPAPAAAAKKGDEFENLVDSVEDSLAKAPEAAPVAPVAAAPAAPAPAAMAAPQQASASNAEKTDEELLKEFENLLNS